MSDDINYQTDMQTIRDYVKTIIELRSRLVTVYLAALENFETTLQAPSADEIKPDFLKAVLKGGFKTAEKKVLAATKEATGLDFTFVSDTVHAVYDEIDRAGQASGRFNVLQWIKKVRTSLANAYARSSTGDEIRKQIEDEYNANDEGGRGGYIGGIQNEQQALNQLTLPKTEELEVALYCAWINEAFDGDCMDGTGLIHLQFDEDGEPQSTTVIAPQDKRIATGLNNQMSSAGIWQLMDLEVVKKICKGDHCACFEPDNTLRKVSIEDEAEAFLEDHSNWEKFRNFKV